MGYRALDCAWGYDNEPEIGEALAEIFKEGKVKREDLFITSKVTIVTDDRVRVRKSKGKGSLEGL